MFLTPGHPIKLWEPNWQQKATVKAVCILQLYPSTEVNTEFRTGLKI